MLGVRRQRSWGDGPLDPDGGVERLPRLVKKTLEPKYATALLYGLQVASRTVKKPAAAKAKTKR
jgi:hypothetical protein